MQSARRTLRLVKYVRFFTSEGRCNIPLSKSLPSLPNIKYSKLQDNLSSDTKITVLDNGLTVATENKFGQFCTVGVVIDSGSRYEVAYPSGINHFLEKLSFNSTLNFKNKDHILKEFENQCGICDCQSSRDTLIYAASAETRGLSKVIEILSDVVLQPNFTNEEVMTAQKTITYELEDLDMKPDQEPLLMEMIHAAAFRDNTLGLPKLCPTKNISKINKTLLYTYMRDHFTPKRMVIAGVGVDHDALLEAVSKHFFAPEPVWARTGDLLDRQVGVDDSLSQYSGGVVKKEKDMSNISLGPNPLPELAHLVLGLESVKHGHPDFVACCVLNMMMGGGGSFSAGGPGKGMYTRLYLNVLNVQHWIFNATAYNHAYRDNGIFCIHASAHPSQLGELTEVIVREIVGMTKRISKTELDRAKTQLQSMLMMNLEARPVIFEDIGRQVLAMRHRKSPQQLVQEISQITEEDVHRVATKLLQSKPSIAALGTLKNLPSYEQIQAGLIDKDGRLPHTNRYSIFG